MRLSEFLAGLGCRVVFGLVVQESVSEEVGRWLLGRAFGRLFRSHFNSAPTG
jgi:hypothetical protein